MDVLVRERGDHDELPTAARGGGARDRARALALPRRARRRALPLGRAGRRSRATGRAWRSARCATSTAASTSISGRSRAAPPSSSSGTARTSTAAAAARRPSTRPGERARRCPVCGHAAFPRLSPAVIVRVTRGDEILLARAQRFPGTMYSVLAGFVEPGESLEECVARELEEEVGIEVGDITYFASQPWPFPHSLMIGFTATWRQRRPAHRGGRADRRALVHARRPARAAGPPVDRPQADRRLALTRPWPSRRRRSRRRG